MDERQNDAAMQRPAGVGDGQDVPHVPPLPAGYQAQPAWRFRDQRGRVYEFNRVYGLPDRRDKRGAMRQLDQDLSYWVPIWPTSSESREGHVPGRALTYAEARKRPGRLTFAQFSSLTCIFRTKPITNSGRSRSSIPDEADHRFRRIAITDSGRSRSVIRPSD